ncbi:hypothetical protein [Peribacillus aracenensis]|nr:hypothetical protein [Peribacillus sp. BBB004]
MTKSKNPVIKKAREEGIKIGMKIGQKKPFYSSLNFWKRIWIMSLE